MVGRLGVALPNGYGAEVRMALALATCSARFQLACMGLRVLQPALTHCRLSKYPLVDDAGVQSCDASLSRK